MALSQHENHEMILKALSTLTEKLENEPPDYPENAATTIIWGGELTDPQSGKVGHVVVYLLLTEDEQKITTVTDALTSQPFQAR